MGEVNVTWHGDAILAQLQSTVMRAIDGAGDLLAGRTAAKVLVPYPPASSPGQAPHARRGISGGLAGAIGHRVTRAGDNITLAVGVPATSANAPVAGFLQRGTARMRPRPWMPAKAEAAAFVTDAVTAAVRRCALMGAKVLDDFTGEAVLTDAAGNPVTYLLFDRSAVKVLDGLIPRGSTGLLVQPPATPSDCAVVIMAGSAGYQRRNPGTKRITDIDQAWDVVRDCGGPLVLAAPLANSLSCAEDLGLRSAPEGDADPFSPYGLIEAVIVAGVPAWRVGSLTNSEMAATFRAAAAREKRATDLATYASWRTAGLVRAKKFPTLRRLLRSPRRHDHSTQAEIRADVAGIDAEFARLEAERSRREGRVS